MQISRRRRFVGGALLLVTLLLVSLGLIVQSPQGSNVTAADTCQYFSQTGYQVCGRFLDYWLQHGGVTQQGYPISNVINEQNQPPPAGDGQFHQVQYFERARFESHPENSYPNDVLLGLLGREQYNAKYNNPFSTPVPQPTPTPTPAPTQGTNYFPAYSCLTAASAGPNDSWVQSCITDIYPQQHTNVAIVTRFVINGKLVTDYTLYTNWIFYTVPDRPVSCKANSDGVAYCQYNIGGASVDGKYQVNAALTYANRPWQGTFYYVPR
jgi:hypothetical protein